MTRDVLSNTPATITGRIYKIYHQDNPNMFYIGSTSKRLSKRLQQHKDTAKYNPDKKSRWLEYLRTKNIDNFEIVLLEELKTGDKTRLREREDYYIRQLKPALNQRRALLSPEDVKAYNKTYRQRYNQLNSAHIKQQAKKNAKKYRLAHSNAIRQKKKLYNQNRPICYTCSLCDYETNRPQHALKHQQTSKHIRNEKFELYYFIRQQFEASNLGNPFQST